MTLTLYQGSISTCSQKVRLVLAEKDLPFAIRDMDVPAGEHLSDWYLRLNPNGVVPTLVHDGVAIVDSSVICEYLDEVFADPPLVPAGPAERAGMRAWMRYFEEVPTAAIRVPSYNRVLVRHFQALDPADRAARQDRMPLRRHFYEDLGQDGFSSTQYNRSMERLEACLRRVEAALADGRSWLCGGFSIADIVLLPSVIRMLDIGLAPLWANLPRVADWLARAMDRPSFAMAYYPGSRLEVHPAVDGPGG